MITKNKIYIIIGYVSFVLPPFIWGFVEIYSKTPTPHVTSLIINLILLLITISVLLLLIKSKKLQVPSLHEQKTILFGFIGNIVVYFYTFQNFMNIENWITIYLVILIILGIYSYLFTKKLEPKELWFFASLFIIIDTTHLFITGCGFTEGYSCFVQSSTTFFMYILYSVIVFASLFYYLYEILKLKCYDLLKLLNLIIVITLSVIAQFDHINGKFTATLFILYPFFILIDFIILIVNKSYTHKTLLYYLRTVTIFAVFSFLGSLNFFQGESNYEILAIMVGIMYYSLFLSILTYLLPIHREAFNTKVILLSQLDATQLFDSIPDNERVIKLLDQNNNVYYERITIIEYKTYREAQMAFMKPTHSIKHIQSIIKLIKKENINQLKITDDTNNINLLNDGFIKVQNSYFIKL